MQLRPAIACALLLSGCAGTKATLRTDRLAFALPDLSGKTVELESLGGKVVLLDLWATWCKPCVASLPFYAALHRRHEREGFTVVAVSVDTRDEDVARFFDQRPVPFPVLRDPKGKLPAALEIDVMPTSLLIGRDGAVLHVQRGFDPADEAAVEARVTAALGTASAP